MYSPNFTGHTHTRTRIRTVTTYASKAPHPLPHLYNYMYGDTCKLGTYQTIRWRVIDGRLTRIDWLCGDYVNASTLRWHNQTTLGSYNSMYGHKSRGWEGRNGNLKPYLTIRHNVNCGRLPRVPCVPNMVSRRHYGGRSINKAPILTCITAHPEVRREGPYSKPYQTIRWHINGGSLHALHLSAWLPARREERDVGISWLDIENMVSLSSLDHTCIPVLRLASWTLKTWRRWRHLPTPACRLSDWLTPLHITSPPCYSVHSTRSPHSSHRQHYEWTFQHHSSHIRTKFTYCMTSTGIRAYPHPNPNETKRRYVCVRTPVIILERLLLYWWNYFLLPCWRQ